MLYLIAGAYSFGYQDQFGFTYLSLGVEDLVITSRPVMVQLVMAALSVTIVWAILRTLFLRFSPGLVGTIVSLLPLTLIGAFLLTSVDISEVQRFNPQTFWIFGGYYALEFLRFAIRCGRPVALRRLADHLVPLRFIQAVVGGVLLLLLAFDLGVLDAIKQRDFNFCPRQENADWVEVQLTGDLVVCAEADVKGRLIYSRFRYFKIKDGPDGIILEKRAFAPRCIGMPKNSREWSAVHRSECASNEGS